MTFKIDNNYPTMNGYSLVCRYRIKKNDDESIQNWINLMGTSLYKMHPQNKPTILMVDINIDLLSDKVDKLQKSHG